MPENTTYTSARIAQRERARAQRLARRERELKVETATAAFDAAEQAEESATEKLAERILKLEGAAQERIERIRAETAEKIERAKATAAGGALAKKRKALGALLALGLSAKEVAGLTGASATMIRDLKDDTAGTPSAESSSAGVSPSDDRDEVPGEVDGSPEGELSVDLPGEQWVDHGGIPPMHEESVPQFS